MKKKITLTFILAIFLSNCTEPSISNQRSTELLLKAKVAFGKDYLNNFPNEINATESSIFITYESCLYGHPRVLLKETFSLLRADFGTKLKQLLSKSKVSYPANKECMYVIDPFRNKKNKYSGYPILKDTLLLNRYIQKCYLELYPVPNFYSLYSNEDKKDDFRLPKDFIIHIIDAQSGLFEKNKFRLRKTYIPPPWTHGYSKGFAVSEKREAIIYWFLIW